MRPALATILPMLAAADGFQRIPTTHPSQGGFYFVHRLFSGNRFTQIKDGMADVSQRGQLVGIVPGGCGGGTNFEQFRGGIRVFGVMR